MNDKTLSKIQRAKIISLCCKNAIDKIAGGVNRIYCEKLGVFLDFSDCDCVGCSEFVFDSEMLEPNNDLLPR